MEGRFSDIELGFIREVLDLHGEYMADLFYDSIGQKNLIRKGNLRSYFESNMPYKVSMRGQDPHLEFTFPTYGRLAEIGYHRKSTNTLRQWRSENTAAVWGIKAAKKKKKDTRWYAKNFYGSLNRLIGILMYEFSDEMAERIKLQLQNSKKIHLK